MVDTNEKRKAFLLYISSHYSGMRGKSFQLSHEFAPLNIILVILNEIPVVVVKNAHDKFFF